MKNRHFEEQIHWVPLHLVRTARDKFLHVFKIDDSSSVEHLTALIQFHLRLYQPPCKEIKERKKTCDDNFFIANKITIKIVYRPYYFTMVSCKPMPQVGV